MWFRNLRPFRMTRGFDLSAEQLEEQLATHAFKPCTPAQALSVGWVAALGEDTQQLAHAADGRYLLCLEREEKILPPAVVRDLLKERIAGIEGQQGRKVYRRERLALKDEIVHDCLPRAFSRRARIRLLLDPRSRWVLVDSASAGRAEEALNLLRECVGTFPVIPLTTAHAPAAAMTSWLSGGSVPEGFALRDECELREHGEQPAVLRCKGIDLTSEEIRQHLDGGMQVARLALDWREQLQFVLGEDLCLRRLRFGDALVKENDPIADEDPLARLDADFALMAPLLGELPERLVALFGGEETR
jgi:recombination associated protein RdgC